MNVLTDRQAAILAYVREQIEVHHRPPCRGDITDRFGYASRSTAEHQLRKLEEMGYIEVLSGSRGIRLLPPAKSQVTLQFELPLIGNIAAGTPIQAETNIETRIPIDPRLFRPRADFLHRVSGHSMKEADILDGDIVGIHAQAEALNNQIVAAVVLDRRSGEELITLKRYVRRGTHVILKPENSNPRYQRIEIDLAATDRDSQEAISFRIAGIFAGLIRFPK
jgi:repressor LexA